MNNFFDPASPTGSTFAAIFGAGNDAPKSASANQPAKQPAPPARIAPARQIGALRKSS